MRRLRSLVTALAVLALSAGIAFAARQMPQQAAAGLAKAADAAGKTVPVDHSTVTAPDDEQAADVEDQGDTETDAPDEDTETTDSTDTHGTVVSEAAQGETPDGWANHGAYVSAVAHGDAQPGDPAPEAAVANGGRMPKPDLPAQAANHAKPDKASKPAH